MNTKSLTPLTEGAMLSALTVILGLLAVYLPVLGLAASFFWTLPIVVLTVRHGLRYGVMALIAAGAILALLVTPVISLKMMLSYSFMALGLGLAFGKAWPGTRAFALGLGGSVLGKLALFGLLLTLQLNPMEMELSSMKEAFESTFKLYEELGMEETAISEAKANVSASLELVGLILPFIFFCMALIDTVVTYWAGGKVLRRLGVEVSRLPPFKEWRLPPIFPYLLGFALIGIYWGETRNIQALYEISLNVNMLTLLAGAIQGFSLCSCVADHFKISRLWRIFFVVLVMLNGFLAQMLAFTGLFDMLFDYRRRFGGQMR